MGRERLERPPAAIAGEVLAEDLQRPLGLGQLAVGKRHVQHALAQRQGVFNPLGDSPPAVRTDHNAVDDDFHAVAPPPIDVGNRVEGMHPAVDPHADVARGADFLPERLVPLADRDLDRGHQKGRRARPLRHHLGDDLVRRLGADRQIALGAMGLAEAGHEDSQVVVDFRHGADRRAG